MRCSLAMTAALLLAAGGEGGAPPATPLERRPEAGPGAFYSLHEAREGDAVRIRTADGRTFTYRVTAVRSYRKNALPASIFSSAGRPRLVLVTCGGPFNPSTGHYRDNVVLTAVPA